MLSPSELQSLFGGLGPPHIATGLGRTGDAGLHALTAAGQFTLPLVLNPEQQAVLQSWQLAFAERWKQTWPEPLRLRFAIENSTVEATRLQDFATAHVDWQRFQIQATSPDFTLWIAVDDCLATAHLDCLLGACETDLTPNVPRQWGPLERQLTTRLIQAVCDSLTLPGNQQPRWHFERLDSPSDWIAGAPVFLASELVQFTFEVKGPRSTGHMSLGIPRQLMQAALEFPTVEQTSLRPALTGEPLETVTLRATLDTVKLSRGELEELQVGDVLLTGQDAQSECVITVNGEPKFQATIGSHEGHKAVRLLAEM